MEEILDMGVSAEKINNYTELVKKKHLDMTYLKNEDFLFSSLWKASEEELRGNIAVFLAQTSMSNRIAEQYEQAKHTILMLKNKFFNSSSKASQEDSQTSVKYMIKEIEENQQILSDLSKDSLFELLVGKIYWHVMFKSKSEELRTDTLSEHFINYIACQYKHIDTMISPRAKADAVITQISIETEAQLAKLLQNLHELPDKERSTALLKIKDIGGTTEEQRREIQRQIATGDIDTKSLLKLSAGLGTVGLMGSAGFGLYAGAASIIHGIGTMTVGALPFGIYAGTMSTLSLITGPIGMAAVLGVTGIMMFKDTVKANARAMHSILMLARQYHGVLFDADEEYSAFSQWHKKFGTNEALREEVQRMEASRQREQALMQKRDLEIEFMQRNDKTKTDVSTVGGLGRTRTTLIKLFNEATREINILSPWIGWWFAPGEPLYNAIRSAVERGVTVKLLFGMNENESVADSAKPNTNSLKDSEKREIESIKKANELRRYYKEYPNFCIARTYSHNKIILIDDDCYVKTSINILSNHKNKVDEDTIIVKSNHMVEEARKTYFSFGVNESLSKILFIDK